MTKSELIAAIAAHGNTSKAEAERALASVTDVIGAALANGLDVSVPGFGSFSVAVRAERQGRNPATGEAITIPAGRAVKFKAAGALKNKVNR